MFDGFARLRHHTVIRRYHQNHDIGRLRTTRPHGGKRLVARGIQKSDYTTLGRDVVSANMLGNAPCFAHRHFGTADVIQQRGFAMIHVAHYGHHRCTRQQFGSLCFHLFLGKGFRVVQRGLHRHVAHLFNHDHGCILIQRLVDGNHLSQLHQHLDHLRCLDRHFVCQLSHGNGFGYVNFKLFELDRGLRLFFFAPMAIATLAPTRA